MLATIIIYKLMWEYIVRPEKMLSNLFTGGNRKFYESIDEYLSR